MPKKIDMQKEENEKATPLSVFMDSYNKNIPPEFPAASVKKLNMFRKTHPRLFKEGDDSWVIDKHRKRFFDWLYSHNDGS